MSQIRGETMFNFDEVSLPRTESLQAHQFEQGQFPVDKEKFDVKTGKYQGHNVLQYKPWQVEKYTRI